MNRSHSLLLALLRLDGIQWSFIAREARRQGTVAHLVDGNCSETSKAARDSLAAIHAQRTRIEEAADEARAIVEAASYQDISLTTVLDDDFPTNLRAIDQLPPLLFYRGTLSREDDRALAVVGTRRASTHGLHRASELAAMLARAGFTVVSGLARGVDTAAHSACIESGGRTLAVLGSGMWHLYPPENAALANSIADGHGAVISQFWPDTSPSRKTFPIRNAVSSGLSLGTIVIEASSTSGAKMQARLALEQGRHVLLPQSLVDSQAWARQYVERGAMVIPSLGALRSTLGADKWALSMRPECDRRDCSGEDAAPPPSLFATG